MSGIERLRTLAVARDEWILGGTLAEIADQIERELQEERDRWDSELCEAQMDKSRVTVVYLEMNKHVLGHEGMEDSPVARWARELREALGGAVTDEDREAAEWVRKRGGIDYVKAEWRSRVPYDRYERRRQSLLGHIAECETALGRRNRRIEELEGERDELYEMMRRLNDQADEMEARLMPEGMEWLVEAWPRFEDGEPVRGGDEVCGGGRAFIVDHVVLFSNGESTVCAEADIDSGKVRDYARVRPGYRLKRPAPKLLDADGADTSVGDTVYEVDTGEKMWVYALPEQGAYQCVKLRLINGMFKTLDPCRLTHRAPVLAGDGKPLEVGQTVYVITNGKTHHVTEVDAVSKRFRSMEQVDGSHWLDPTCFTHQRPVLDADGVPIREGDTVWSVNDGTEYKVGGIKVTADVDGDPCKIIECSNDELHIYYVCIPPDKLTHTKPEIDSWERLEEDAEKDPCCYFGFDGEETCGKCPASGKNCEQTMARDLVRRCRALAERERGE